MCLVLFWAREAGCFGEVYAMLCVLYVHFATNMCCMYTLLYCKCTIHVYCIMLCYALKVGCNIQLAIL